MITLPWLFVLLLAGYAVLSVAYYFARIRPRLRRLAEAASPAVRPDDVEGSPGSRLPPGAGLTLQRSLEEWHRTFDAIMDPVLILDRDLSIIKGNRAAHQLLAVNDEPIEGRKCHQLFAGSEEVCQLCPVQRVRDEGHSRRQEITHRYLGRTFSVSCSPITADGEIIGYVHSAKDISHQRNLEKQLIQAHKMEAIATMAGGIAHDFNNILGAILGNADLLLYRLPAKGGLGEPAGAPSITIAEIEEHVQAIKRAGIRAKDLVSQILAFSRQSTSKRTNLLIAPVVKETCRLLRASLPATIEFKVTVAQDIGLIYADAGQIQQVLMNLCTNAAQAIDRQAGSIEVSLREVVAGRAEQLRYHDLVPGRYVVLTVTDTGKGIAPDMLERIFDPFFTTREVGDGTGMGLAVLHGIIVAHDGIIDVKSEVGKGSVFTVFFPRVFENGVEDDVMTALPRGTETVLFVDDEEDIVKMRSRMLGYLGYRVLTATNPEQALGHFTRGQAEIDVVITDHTMPRMTGLQLAAEISRLKPAVPIILCSGYSEAVTPEEARQAGIQRFLAKPVDMRLLANAIRELLAPSSKEDQ
jgi:two-component system, cell cycle sensor histidine kinase and response regulator CckA